ncbi:MAG: hypothetical protein IT223_05355, partial [Crocinitomicaceae bacterium]|nr:hypothetical protein [Crocinitomicaceae bacterium]
MKTTFFSSVLLLGVLFSSAQTTAPAQSIIVNGYSEVKIPADIIHLDVTISNAYIDASSITQLVDQYNSLLRKLGVDAKKSVLKDTQKYEPLPGDDF